MSKILIIGSDTTACIAVAQALERIDFDGNHQIIVTSKKHPDLDLPNIKSNFLIESIPFINPRVGMQNFITGKEARRERRKNERKSKNQNKRK